MDNNDLAGVIDWRNDKVWVWSYPFVTRANSATSINTLAGLDEYEREHPDEEQKKISGEWRHSGLRTESNG
jgi:hypothetical protein